MAEIAIDAGAGADLVEIAADVAIVATLSGGEGDDTLIAGAMSDSIDAGPGNDSVIAGDGYDTVVGGDGSDTIDSGACDDFVDAGAGDDSVLGGDGDDTITCGAGNDIVLGGDGDDLLNAGAGSNSVDGGVGFDTFRFAGTEAADSILLAGAGDDLVSVSASVDVDMEIDGGAGNDTLAAGSGHDVLDGGPGADVISGGDGYDLVRFVGTDSDDSITAVVQRDDPDTDEIEVDELTLLGTIHRGTRLLESADYWAAYVMGAYEGAKGEDNDPNFQTQAFGYTTLAEPEYSAVFVEVIRDATEDDPEYRGGTIVARERRTVVHEIGHQFELQHVPKTVMSTRDVLFGVPDRTEYDQFHEMHLALIRAIDKP